MPFATPGTARKGSTVDNPFCELFPCLGGFCNNRLRANAILRLATPRGRVRASSVAPLRHTPRQGSGATGRARHIKPQKRPPRRQTVAGLRPSGARSRSIPRRRLLETKTSANLGPYYSTPTWDTRQCLANAWQCLVDIGSPRLAMLGKCLAMLGRHRKS